MSFFFLLFLAFKFYGVESVDDVHAEKHINGGYQSTSNNFPYQVRVLGRYVHDNWLSTSRCGGSILDDYHVISAAHCFINEQTRQFALGTFHVVAGAIDFDKDNRSQWIRANVKKIYVPKLYFDSLQTNVNFTEGDIAILRLDKSLDIIKNKLRISNVRLPFDEPVTDPELLRDEPYVGKLAFVSGYGVNKFFPTWDINKGKPVQKGCTDGKLRFAHTFVINNLDCQNQWRKYNSYKYSVSKSHICARVDNSIPTDPKGVCGGDSGGPLIILKNFMLIGVVNAGPTGCVEKIVPHVYARVSFYKDFINKARQDISDPHISTKDPPIENWQNFYFDFDSTC